MVAKVAARPRPQRERLRRLAIVFKVAIRLKIVAELYMRAMSPKEFFEEFGGGSVVRVSQQFALLESHGWLRRIGYKDRETKRRGRSETLYRATEMPFFDAETWALLPYSLRLACSWSLFKATANELREGIEGYALEGRPSRGLTCTPLELDEISWERVIAKLDADFESIFEEQEDAKIRSARTGEELRRAGILQIGFESPRSEDRLASRLADGSFEPLVPFPQRMAPLLADDLALQILTELNRSDMSVKQFHRELAPDNITEGTVRWRFDRLKELAWIAVVDQVKKRAAYENIFRAAKPVVTPDGLWACPPDTLAKTKTWKTFARLSELVKESIVAGTFDMRDDRHLSWSIVHLDQDGWLKVIANLGELEIFLDEEAGHAEKRIAAGARPLTMIVGLMAVEWQGDFVKAP